MKVATPLLCLGLLLGSVLMPAAARAASAAETTVAGQTPQGLSTAEWGSIQDQIGVTREVELSVPGNGEPVTDGDGTTSDRFGTTVSLDGDTLAVGRPEYAISGTAGAVDNRRGSVFIFTRTASGWVKQARLGASDGVPGDGFGQGVVLSGNTVLVRASRLDRARSLFVSKFYVFVRNGGSWTQQTRLTNPGDAGGFGFRFDLSGDTALVQGLAGDVYVFARSGTQWSVQARLLSPDGGTASGFGNGLALLGDNALVGAPFDNHGARNQGAVFSYARSGATWTLQSRFIASDGSQDDYFGTSLALSADTAIVGVPQDRGSFVNQGSAYVFVRNGASWTQQAKLLASDPGAEDYFGFSVALSGDTLAVGAPLDDNRSANRGAVYLFARTGASWAQQSKLVVADGQRDDQFGAGLELDGDTLVASSPGDDFGLADLGSANVFARSGATWTQQARLVTPEPSGADRLGYAVAVSGDIALVGAPFEGPGLSHSGAAYVFARSASGWQQQARIALPQGAGLDRFGFSVSLEGDTALIGAPSAAYLLSNGVAIPGAAYVYTRSGGTWTQQARLAAADAAVGDEFGFSVSLSGDTALVGAPGNQTLATAGAAHVFTRSGDNWNLQTRLADAGSRDFGYAVAVSGNAAVVGAPEFGARGLAYTYRRTGTNWALLNQLKSTDDVLADGFGSVVALSATALRSVALIGAPQGSSSFPEQGAAYVFSAGGSGNYFQEFKLASPDASAYAHFGNALAVVGDVALAGAPDAGAGATYLFTRNGSIWNPRARFVDPDGAPGDALGGSVALAGDRIVLGSPGADAGARMDAGSATLYRLAADYGDAPDPAYRTLSSRNGARHLVGNLRLGARLDAELDGQPNATATGDDLAGGSNDEDGVSFGALRGDAWASLDLDVRGSSGYASASVWIDYNRDGDWDDADELILPFLFLPEGVTQDVPFYIPATALAGPTFARVRLSSNFVSRPDGLAADGEVVDQRVEILPSLPRVSFDESILDQPIGEDAGTIVIGAQLSKPSTETISVTVRYYNQAVLGQDFTTDTETLVFLPGQTRATIRLQIIDDAVDEDTEFFGLLLRAPPNAVLGSASKRSFKLQDNDEPPTVFFTQAQRTVGEGSGTLAVTAHLSGASAKPVRAQLRYAGTALRDRDYRTDTTTFVFAPGQTLATLNLTFTDDALDEADETISLLLRAATNATPGSQAELVITLTDNDAPPTVSLRVVGQTVGEGAGTAVVEAVLSGPSGLLIRVPVSFAGSASLTRDYSRSSTQFSFPAGSTSAVITLSVVDDALSEATETVSLTLGTSANVQLGAITTNTVSIADND